MERPPHVATQGVRWMTGCRTIQVPGHTRAKRTCGWSGRRTRAGCRHWREFSAGETARQAQRARRQGPPPVWDETRFAGLGPPKAERARPKGRQILPSPNPPTAKDSKTRIMPQNGQHRLALLRLRLRSPAGPAHGGAGQVVAQSGYGTLGVDYRIGAVTRSHAHEIVISGVITVRFSTERPGVGPEADVRQSVAKPDEEGDDVHQGGGYRAAGGARSGLVGLLGCVFEKGMTQRPGRRSGHTTVVLPSANLDSHRAQTLGQPSNSVTVCKNTFSVAIGATLRAVRFRLRGGHCRTTGGVAGAAKSWIGRWTYRIRHGAATAGRPGGGQANSDDVRKFLASDRRLSIGRR